MKIIYVELLFNNSILEEIKLNTIRKYKSSYYFDCVFKVKYQDEYLQDILTHLIKKANLEKNHLVINYNYDNISFLKVSLPKMSNLELVKNIDSELNNLIPNYKELFSYKINKVSSYKVNEFRTVLYPKRSSSLDLNQYSLKDLKIKKVKEISNYEIIEEIFKTYKYKSNITYGICVFYENKVEIYSLCNGIVIELFVLDLEENLLKQYNLSYKYDDLLNVNNKYFKTICEFINNYSISRNIDGIILMFTNCYNEYLKKLIDQEISINHIIKDYELTYYGAIEDLFYEK